MPSTEELQAQIEALRSEVATLRGQLGGQRPAHPETRAVSHDIDAKRSRRNVLKLTVAGLGGAGLAQMAVSPASAANGDALLIGNAGGQTATLPTGVAVTGSSAGYGLAFTDNGLNSVPLPSAVVGHARGLGIGNWTTGVLGVAVQDSFYGVVGDSVRCGLYGIARGPADNGWPAVLGEGNGDGMQGRGKVGLRGRAKDADGAGVIGETDDTDAPALWASGDSGLLALNGVQAAPPSTGTFRRGDVLNDANGSGVWICVEPGSPGVWRKVAGAKSAGSFHVVDGFRAFDSRKTGGKLAASQTRTVTISGSTIPSKATAVHHVLTALSTSGKGSLVAFPATRRRPAISSLVWYGANQKHAVGLTTGLSATRQLKIYATGGSTHFLVDVLGYYL